MRYFAFIFSLYFTLLALLPCQDRDDMIASVAQVTIQKNNSPDDGKSQESCPPFCICSCCSTARHITTAIVTHVFTKPIIRKYPDFGITAVQEQPIKIWQPPQIG